MESSLLLGIILTNTPAIIILTILLTQVKKEGTPRRILILLSIAGALLIIPITLLQTSFNLFVNFEFFSKHPLVNEFFMTVIRLAFIEETCKFVVTKIITWKGSYFKNTYQGMILPAIVGLFFGLVESILFLMLISQQMPDNYWLTVLLRALIGAPAHGAYGLLIGKFYVQAKLSEQIGNKKLKIKNLWLALLIPSLIHGLYDWLVASQFITFGSEKLLPTIIILLDILVIIYAYVSLYREKKQKRSWV